MEIVFVSHLISNNPEFNNQLVYVILYKKLLAHYMLLINNLYIVSHQVYEKLEMSKYKNNGAELIKNTPPQDLLHQIFLPWLYMDHILL